MITVSVQLPVDTKARLDRLAEVKGMTPDAFIVAAIDAEIERADKYRSFVADAIRSRDEMLATGKAYDGEEFIAYLRARSRGEKAQRPELKSLESLAKKRK